MFTILVPAALLMILSGLITFFGVDKTAAERRLDEIAAERIA